jgi:serine phosphatase RsbU (regulator of sigma subunit)
MSIQTVAYNTDNQTIVFGGKAGLIFCDKSKQYNYRQNKHVILTGIQLIGTDSLLNMTSGNSPEIPYKLNSLQFNYSLPEHPAIGKIEYRYFLKGFDTDSSNWTSQTTKEYTNLAGGDYEFVVQARNQFQQNLPETTYKFSINTPIYFRWWTFIIYAALIFFAVRAFLNYRMKKAKKEREVLESIVKERTEEIERAKEEIESQRDAAFRQRKEIMDSINYAKRIQQAVLPSDEFAADILGEHFILFKPRDIVSGDFYWIKKLKNFTAVVAADCTGHGVPGAFMSMLGSSFLNEIVTRRSLDSAGEILDNLRQKIKTSLGQTGASGEQKDGMDISFFIIDNETLELQYAGAYNPLYIIRKDDSEESGYKLIRLKADRQPIGIHIREKEFTNHIFRLQKGDSLYAFSDGYIDQFGGEAGGKFKTARFKNLLIDIQDKSMQEQHDILEHSFEKWKGDLEQIDDVLVIGMRM